MALGIVLGAPKILTIPDEVRRTLGAVRMDICGFVGVSARGPVRRHQVDPGQCIDVQWLVDNWDLRDRSLATKITSWDHYRNLFGGFNSPGRLPYSVANFFEQGGQQAYVVRIVHQYAETNDNLSGVAHGNISNLLSAGTAIALSAKNEGQWGNHLRAAAGFTFTPIEFVDDKSDATSITLADKQRLVSGSLLRVINDDLSTPANNYAQYRFIEQLEKRGDSVTQLVDWQIDFSTQALPAKPTKLQWVQGQISIEDTDSGLTEQFSELELSPSLTRFIGMILFTESTLVDPHPDWLLTPLLPNDIDPFEQDLSYLSSQQQLAALPTKFSNGKDRFEDIVHDDFFDPNWVLGNERQGDGIYSLTHKRDCSLLVVPDLYVPEPFEQTRATEQASVLSGAEFSPCVVRADEPLDVELARPSLPGLILDPGLPGDRAKIILLQQKLVDLAKQLREFIVLLDVPPKQTALQILQWRGQFNSEYCAAYHPWLKVNQIEADGQIGVEAKIINPSAVAAGIIAATELRSTVAHGPANQVAQAVFALDTQVESTFHDQIHPLGINVFAQQRDGVWLTGARTLSQQSQWRQLSVVRLMSLLRRALYQQMQWLVFEPNSSSLWLNVQFKLQIFLRQLFTAGLFKGETPQQAYFVRCDETLNTQQVVDAGRLIALIGVAPAEPIEFIVLQISRDADGTLKIVSQ